MWWFHSMGYHNMLCFWGLTGLVLGRTFRRAHGPPGGPADSRDGPRKDGPNRLESNRREDRNRGPRSYRFMRWANRSEPEAGHEAPMAGHTHATSSRRTSRTPDQPNASQPHTSQPHAAQVHARATPAPARPGSPK